MWNHPRNKLSRSASSLSFHTPGERHRTNSFPSRPDSAQSFNSPSRRPVSWHSISSNSSRPNSPASSVASSSREPQSEPRNPVVRERERNWNSHHPKWQYGDPPPRPESPLTQSPVAIRHSHRRLSNASGSPSNSRSNTTGSSSGRTRTVSLGNQTRPRPGSPLLRVSEMYKLQQNGSPPAAATAPTVNDEPERSSSAQGSSYASRFGWSFPKAHNPLPPLELEDSPQEYVSTPPNSRPSSRLSTRPSLIPVRSPRKGDTGSSARPIPPSPPVPPINGVDAERKHGHRRHAAEMGEAISSFTPRIIIEPVDLINAETEELVLTDIESGTFAASDSYDVTY